MYILGIESSCDETAASIVKDGREIVSNIIYSQAEEHGLYGGVVPEMTAVAGLAFLMFNLVTPPCFAALGAMNSEINDRKWFWGGVALQFATGFGVSFLVYQIGTLITTGSVGEGFVPGLVAVIAMAAVVAYLIRKANAALKKEYELKAHA